MKTFKLWCRCGDCLYVMTNGNELYVKASEDYPAAAEATDLLPIETNNEIAKQQSAERGAKNAQRVLKRSWECPRCKKFYPQNWVKRHEMKCRG